MSAYGAVLDRVNRVSGVRGSMVVALDGVNMGWAAAPARRRVTSDYLTVKDALTKDDPA